MNLQLIQGEFNSKEALDIITQMIHVKIKFHEDKISRSSNEEDIKMREDRIKKLQHDLYQLRQLVQSKHKKVHLESVIEVSERLHA
jgi:hypothetical protein